MKEAVSIESLPEAVGEQVHLIGHVQAVRSMGGLSFLVLRSKSGSVQVVVDDPAMAESAGQLPVEVPVAIVGQVVSHPNAKGTVELLAKQIEPLAQPPGPVPVEIGKEKKMTALSLPTMLQYRPLTLRNEKVRAIFKIAAEACRAFREFLGKEGFTEIHSPKIVSTGTEGGANLFGVNYFGRQAYLAQSPQFYKQMMVGVFERVFEIGPVYRAEEHDTSRHLNEYISMDFEMGFIQSEQDVIAMQVKLLAHMLGNIEENCARELSFYEARLPRFEAIPQITLSAAMELLRSKYNWKCEGEDLDPEGETMLCEHFTKEENSEFVYVTQYPRSIRPFYTMPLEGTERSRSFDLLWRGLEITTGGQRIHEHAQLVQSMQSRGLNPENFDDYLQCFRYGMPPHGGLAIGLERFCKQMLGLPNVKLASLFPRDRTRLTP